MRNISKEALDNPQIGDHWTEMFSWDLFVVGIEGDLIFSLEGARPLTFPADGIPKIRTRKEFTNFFTYKTSGYGFSGIWGQCIERGKNVENWMSLKFEKKWTIKDE